MNDSDSKELLLFVHPLTKFLVEKGIMQSHGKGRGVFLYACFLNHIVDIEVI